MIDISRQKFLTFPIRYNADIGTDVPGNDGQFNTTHWSVVLLAGQSQDSKRQAALELLCRSYWYPVYAFVRRKGHSPHDAQDLTQEFFSRLLEKNSFKLASPERGKFRSFLLKSLTHFLVNEWTRDRAQKRGGGQKIISIDEQDAERLYHQEPATDLPPESLYDKAWALALLERGMKRLDHSYATAGKRELFLRLNGMLLSESSAENYRAVGEQLGLSEGAVKVALHRLRSRFRDAVRAEIEDTVGTPSEVEEELRCLMAALRS